LEQGLGKKVPRPSGAEMQTARPSRMDAPLQVWLNNR